MIKITDIIKNDLLGYSNKNNKISREVRDGNLIRIITGLYEINPNTPGYLLA